MKRQSFSDLDIRYVTVVRQIKLFQAVFVGIVLFLLCISLLYTSASAREEHVQNQTGYPMFNAQEKVLGNSWKSGPNDDFLTRASDVQATMHLRMMNTDLFFLEAESPRVRTHIDGGIIEENSLNSVSYNPKLSQVYTESEESLSLIRSLQLPSVTDFAWGDWDNDGDLDLAVSTFGNGIYVFENKGGDLNLVWTSPNLEYTSSIAWGDWDNDGDLDLAVGNQGLGRGQRDRVYENTGGGFVTGWIAPFNDQTLDIEWGDWNGDGYLDLITTSQYRYGAALYINTGGELTGPLYISGADGTTNIAWADWDGDGDMDFAVHKVGVGVLVYENISSTYSSAFTLPSEGEIAWGDWNGDQNLDLIVGNDIYLNSGDDFVLWTTLSGTPGRSEWGDWDLDGDLDLISNGRLYLNTGSMDPANTFSLVWAELENSTNIVSWADWDNDGDLDLTIGNYSSPVYLYSTSGGGLELLFEIPGEDSDSGTVWGDYDSDGDLDLMVGHQLYQNNDGVLSWVWSVPNPEPISNVVWGDWDGDGDLDLLVGYGRYSGTYNAGGPPSELYENLGGDFVLAETLETSLYPGNTRVLSFADLDGDSDLDIVEAKYPPLTRIYLNDSGSLTLTDSFYGSTFGLGDWDGDGDLDLAIGNETEVYEDCESDYTYGSRLVENISGTFLWNSPVGFSLDNPANIDWGDFDGDGDLDLAIGGRSCWDQSYILYYNFPTRIYQNNNGLLSLYWTSISTIDGRVKWVDWDSDGDLDLVTSRGIYRNNQGDFSEYLPFGGFGSWGDFDGDGDFDLASGNKVYKNLSGDVINMPGAAPRAKIMHPFGPETDGTSSATLFNNRVLTVTYELFGVNNSSVRFIEAFYSLNGGGNWIPAIAFTGTITTNLQASPEGTSHTYYWDIYQSNFFGSSDQVVFRLDIYQGFSNPGPYQYAYRSARTLPFRVRGNQIQVTDESGPVLGAHVYRQTSGIDDYFRLYIDMLGRPFQTNAGGYLQGREELRPGDQLVALRPVSTTQEYVLYHTSASPTVSGVNSHVVTVGGVQTLTVSADNSLILFDLVVSLEWDARQDTTFLEQLQRDIRRTSEILFDVTNGQAALGQVHIYHDRGYWGQAHVVIPAANTIRPSAILGGSVITPTHDIVSPTLTITNAYIPGQVRMPPTWNRFGEPSGTLGEDWPRTLAHELVHYFFFHPDNYLGLSDAGLLRIIDCPGSIMSDPYLYDELLTRTEWDNNPACQQTLSQQYLGRADWETVSHFYGMLNTTDINSGPTTFPLDVTKIAFYDPPAAAAGLSAPFFRLQNTVGEPAPIPNGQAQVYLIKQRDLITETVPYVIAQGVPVGDMVHVRGAASGDRLCVFDYSQQPLRVGCETVGNVAEPVTLHQAPGWRPQIQVTPVSTSTVVVTVSGVNDDSLMARLLPASGRASEATWMIRQGDVFTQTLTAPDGAYYGYVQVWNPDSPSPRELIVEFVGIDDWGGRSYAWGVDPYDWRNPGSGWGGRSYAWGGRSYAWGGRSYAWGAPMMSSDGQVSVFPLDNLFGENEGLSLQQLFLPPDLPAWLTPVGQGYRFTSGETVGIAAIIFRYLPRDVPSGYENVLRVYYSPDEGQMWQRLSTELDTYRNHASAMMPGQGIYVLVATVEVSPAFAEGWNMFGYPVQQTQPITSALASIDGRYTAVANYDPNRPEPWHTYYVTVTAPFTSVVNTLSELAFTKAYWLYATEPITLYLSPGLPGVQLHAPENIQFPPATYYGWITPTAGFTPTVGMTVTGWINGSVCGQTSIEELDGKLAYNLQIVAENAFGTPNGCGAPGRVVQFRVGEWVMGHNHVWDNSQAWFRSLDTVAIHYSVFLPLVVKTGEVMSQKPGNASGFSVVLPALLPMMLVGVVSVITRRKRA